MENTTGITNILGKENNGQFSLVFTCEGYNLLFLRRNWGVIISMFISSEIEILLPQ